MANIYNIARNQFPTNLKTFSNMNKRHEWPVTFQPAEDRQPFCLSLNYNRHLHAEAQCRKHKVPKSRAWAELPFMYTRIPGTKLPVIYLPFVPHIIHMYHKTFRTKRNRIGIELSYRKSHCAGCCMIYLVEYCPARIIQASNYAKTLFEIKIAGQLRDTCRIATLHTNVNVSRPQTAL